MRLSLDTEPIGKDNPAQSTAYQEQRFGEVYLERGQVLAATFINDKGDGSPDKDRNLYIDHLTLTPERAP